MGDPFPQPAALPVRNVCHVSSLSACNFHLPDPLPWHPTTLNLFPVEATWGHGGTMIPNSSHSLHSLEVAAVKVT